MKGGEQRGRQTEKSRAGEQTLPESIFNFRWQQQLLLLTVAASCCRLCLLTVCLSRSACPSVQLSALSALSAKRATATFFADNAVIKIQLQLKVRTQSAQTTNKAKGNAREPKGETKRERVTERKGSAPKGQKDRGMDE